MQIQIQKTWSVQDREILGVLFKKKKKEELGYKTLLLFILLFYILTVNGN